MAVNSVEGEEFVQWLQVADAEIQYNCCPGVLMPDVSQQLACREHACRMLARGVDDHPEQL